MSEQNYPDFYKRSEEMNSLTPEQLEQSRQLFDTLFDDIMLRHMGDVSIFGKDTDGQHASLLKILEVNGQPYTLSLDDKGQRNPKTGGSSIEFRDSEKLQRLISVQRKDTEGRGREYWSYRLGADGIVRRWDMGDAWDNIQKKKELGIAGPRMLSGGETPEEMTQAIQANITEIAESLPNSRLEEDMGINNQPVSPEEVAGLKDFIDSATVLERKY